MTLPKSTADVINYTNIYTTTHPSFDVFFYRTTVNVSCLGNPSSKYILQHSGVLDYFQYQDKLLLLLRLYLPLLVLSLFLFLHSGTYTSYQNATAGANIIQSVTKE